MEEFDLLRQEAVDRREYEVRKEAEQKRIHDLDEARQEAERQLEDTIRRMRRELEKAVEREAARVKALMKAEGNRRVEEECKAGQQRLDAAIGDTWERAFEEQMRAVEAARLEERAAAIRQTERIGKEHEQEMEEARRVAEQSRQDAIEKLRADLMEEQNKAVASAVHETDRKAAGALKNVQRSHEARVSELRLQLEGLLQELEKTRLAVSRSESMRKDAEIKLAEMTAEFSHFIDQVPGYSAEYLLK